MVIDANKQSIGLSSVDKAIAAALSSATILFIIMLITPQVIKAICFIVILSHLLQQI